MRTRSSRRQRRPGLLARWRMRRLDRQIARGTGLPPMPPPDATGVREPRRPGPSCDAGAMALPLPGNEDAA